MSTNHINAIIIYQLLTNFNCLITPGKSVECCLNWIKIFSWYQNTGFVLLLFDHWRSFCLLRKAFVCIFCIAALHCIKFKQSILGCMQSSSVHGIAIVLENSNIINLFLIYLVSRLWQYTHTHTHSSCWIFSFNSITSSAFLNQQHSFPLSFAFSHPFH